jgi:hypothetical protein
VCERRGGASAQRTLWGSAGDVHVARVGGPRFPNRGASPERRRSVCRRARSAVSCSANAQHESVSVRWLSERCNGPVSCSDTRLDLLRRGVALRGWCAVPACDSGHHRAPDDPALTCSSSCCALPPGHSILDDVAQVTAPRIAMPDV